LLPGDASADKFSRSIVENFLENGAPEEWRGNAKATAKKFSRQNIVANLLSLYESVIASYREPADISEDWLDLIGAEALAVRLKAEWDLITGKTTAAVKAMGAKEIEKKPESQ
jgi:hypothetical protein